MAQYDGAIVIDLQLRQDEFEKRLNQLEGKTSKFGSKVKVGLTVAATAVATAFGATLKSAIDSYAQYEQLVGGVETLFKDSNKKVMQYANNAYKTAGMSANNYMETVTSFSASLLQSLGGDTQKAADYADRAITDMSDNANKMGTSMEMIQNAYQGFAKQNYTMLDNLKLGYGGTKEETARLVSDASKLTDVQKELGITVDATSLSFANIVNAISVVQKEMGIMGTTSKESSQTIEGSANAMKAAWENLLTGMADENVDFDKLVQNFVDSIVTYVGNIGPRIVQTIPKLASGLAQVVSEIGSMIVSDIPNELKQLLEGIATAISMVTGGFIAFKSALMITALIQKVSAALAALKVAFITLSDLGIGGTIKMMMGFASPVALVVTGIAAIVAGFLYLWNTSESFRNFWIGFWENIKSFTTDAVNAIVEFFTVTLPQGIQSFIDWFSNLPTAIGEWLSATWQSIIEWGQNVINSALEIGQNFLKSIVEFFSQLPYNIGFVIGTALAQIIQWGIDLQTFATTEIPKFILNIIQFFSELPGKILTWLLEALNKVSQWGSDMIQKGKTAASEFISNVISYISQLPSKIGSWFSSTLSNVASFASNFASKALQAGRDFLNNIVNEVSKIPGRMISIGRDIVSGIANGILGGADWLMNQIKGFAGGVVNGFKSFFGIHSPSTVMRDMIGKFLPPGIAVGFELAMPKSMKNINQSLDRMTDDIQRKVDVNMNDIQASATLESNAKLSMNKEIVNSFPKTMKIIDSGKQPIILYLDKSEIAHILASPISEEIALLGGY